MKTVIGLLIGVMMLSLLVYAAYLIVSLYKHLYEYYKFNIFYWLMFVLLSLMIILSWIALVLHVFNNGFQI